MNNKALYESIMKGISKEVKAALHESSHKLVDLSNIINKRDTSWWFDDRFEFTDKKFSAKTVGIILSYTTYNRNGAIEDWETFVPITKIIKDSEEEFSMSMNSRQAEECINDYIDIYYDYIQRNVGEFEYTPEWQFVELKSGYSTI